MARKTPVVNLYYVWEQIILPANNICKCCKLHR